MSNGKEDEAITEINLSVINGRIFVSLSVPLKWLVFAIITYIAWRLPELWNAVETAISILGGY